MPARSQLLLLALACAACAAVSSPRELRITGTEYRFEAPAQAPPGLTAISFHNAGRVRHEVIVVRMARGVTLKTLLANPPAPVHDTLIVGGAAILTADPGDTDDSRILVDLVPGASYALLCTMSDAHGGPPHFTLGMATTLRVE